MEDEASALVTVRSAPVRALLLDAAPGWTTRFVSSALRDDPAVELTSVIALGGAQERVESARDGFDAASIDPGAFELFIVGGGAGRWIDDAALVERVRAGAGLLALAPNDVPRGETGGPSEGLTLDASSRGAVYPDARIRSREVGAGRAASFDGEDAWRAMFGEWADPALPARLARWLAQRASEEFPSVEVDRAAARVGEAVVVSLRYPPAGLPPDGAVVRVVGEGGSEARVEVRRVDMTRPVLSGSFVAERAGVYEARSGEAPWPARFEARPARDDELLAPVDVAGLRAMAARSGGRVIERDDLGGVLEEVRELAAQGTRGDRRAPTPDRRVWAAALAVAALLVEWLMRRLRRA